MEKLISDIKKGIDKRTKYISVIANPHELLDALNDLNSMIGHQDLKDDVAGQVIHLIANKLKKSCQPVMLHSLLYGSPGVGKTTIGTHLARIWHSLGYLKKHNNDNNYKSNEQKVWEDPETFSRLIMVISTLFMLLIICSLIFSASQNLFIFCRNLFGLKWALIILIIIVIVLIIAILYWLFFSSEPCLACNKHSCVCNQLNNKQNSDKQAKSKKHSNLITIISGEDFIGKYVGWSEAKTTQILQENRGKVLFIDEAYSIVSGPQDSYGERALTIINRYMSEHPDEIAIIMAGYKDKMQSSIFSVQPGLVSRFMWTFNCKGYTIEELFEIWKQQLLPWKLECEDKGLELFRENSQLFPGYARDTSRLINFCIIEYNRDLMSNDDYQENVLTDDQLRRGFNIMRRHTMEKDISSNNYNNLLDMLKLCQKK